MRRKDNEHELVLPRIVEEYQKLATAKDLLRDIYIELGPYRTKGDVITDATWTKVLEYFNFDDSE